MIVLTKTLCATAGRALQPSVEVSDRSATDLRKPCYRLEAVVKSNVTDRPTILNADLPEPTTTPSSNRMALERYASMASV